MLLLVPSRLKLKAPHILAKLTLADVTPPPASRLYVRSTGCSTVDLIRQSIKKVGSSILREKEMIRVRMAFMLGSAPENESYWMCQGSVSLRIVPLPLVHLLMAALVT